MPRRGRTRYRDRRGSRDLACAAREAEAHRRERLEELRELVGELGSHHRAQRTPDRNRARTQERAPGAADQRARDARVEEARQARWRIEDVERAARRRRVEHDEIPAKATARIALEEHVVETLHRDVRVRARERPRERAVHPIRENPRARRGVRSDRIDHAVPARARLEHRRVHRASTGDLDRRLRIRQRDPERVGEPSCGIDRQHEHATPLAGGGERERSREAGLPDAARTDAHDQPTPVRDRGGDRRRCRVHATPSSARRPSASSSLVSGRTDSSVGSSITARPVRSLRS